MQNSSKIKQRLAVASDRETIVKFNLALASESEDLELDRETLTLGVQSVLDDPAKGFYLMSEMEGKVVGSLMITEEWSDWRNKNVAWIQSLFVDKAYRGQGVFRSMYDWLENRCKSGDYAGIRLYADKGNRAAIVIYRKMGLDDSHYLFFEKM